MPSKRQKVKKGDSTSQCVCPDACDELPQQVQPWGVTTRPGERGPYGKTLLVEWTSPRPLLEVKIGLGVVDSGSAVGPTNFE